MCETKQIIFEGPDETELVLNITKSGKIILYTLIHLGENNDFVTESLEDIAKYLYNMID